MPEAKLAREAELCYATLALATDYDVWHEEHDAVTRRGGGRQPHEERGDGPRRAGPRAAAGRRPLRRGLPERPRLGRHHQSGGASRRGPASASPSCWTATSRRRGRGRRVADRRGSRGPGRRRGASDRRGRHRQRARGRAEPREGRVPRRARSGQGDDAPDRRASRAQGLRRDGAGDRDLGRLRGQHHGRRGLVRRPARTTWARSRDDELGDVFAHDLRSTGVGYDTPRRDQRSAPPGGASS